MFSCFYFVLFCSDWKEMHDNSKSLFFCWLAVWPSNAAFVMLAQVYPNHEPLLCFYSVIIFIWCCSLVPRQRALLLGAHGLGEETVEILRQFRDSLHGVLYKRLTWSTAGLTVCSSMLFVLPIGNNCLVLLWPLCSYALSQSGSYVLF